MGPLENNAKRREVQAKVKTDPWKLQTQRRQKNPEFALQPRLPRACGALTGQKISGYFPKNFKETLDNIEIYVWATYSNMIGITLKSQKEDVILHLYNL